MSTCVPDRSHFLLLHKSNDLIIAPLPPFALFRIIPITMKHAVVSFILKYHFFNTNLLPETYLINFFPFIAKYVGKSFHSWHILFCVSKLGVSLLWTSSVFSFVLYVSCCLFCMYGLINNMLYNSNNFIKLSLITKYLGIVQRFKLQKH